MTLTPATAALAVSSTLTSLMIGAGAVFGLRIIRKWDLNSGSERQLQMERQTYLVSTLLTYAFVFECVSLFFLIQTADKMHLLFVGAMCAIGTFSASPFGYPALLMKALVFVLSAIWLIMNYADNRASDYPLIRYKYALLLVIAPLSITATALLIAFFLGLEPHVITSCCGALFGSENAGQIASEIAGLPPLPTMIAFYCVISIVALLAFYVWRRDRGHTALGLMSLTALFVSIVSIISFISCYIYELPSHHCPFCVIQADYGYIGYPLYATLFGGASAGMGAGVMGLFRKVPSMSVAGPAIRRGLALWTLVMFLTFAFIVTWKIIGTDFILLP